MQEMVTARGEVIVLIHLFCEIMAPPLNHEGPPIPQMRIACMPNMVEFGETIFHKHYQMTTEAPAVSCPMCKKTSHYTHHMGRYGTAKK